MVKLTRVSGALLSLLIVIVTAASARADVPIATYATQGCPGAPTWNIGYRMYFSDTDGRTTSREAIAASEGEIAKFVDIVGVSSACGVNMHIDVYDEGAAAWPASSQSDRLPADTTSFLSSGSYDWVFYRFPSNAESFCANTSVTVLPNASRFPVDVDGRLGCAGGPSSGDCLCEPWSGLMEHEWLHAVVGFYEPRLGWPTPDVHGACTHNYGTSCNIDDAYFADMMQGKVREGDEMRGITPDEWAQQGTPAHPRLKSLTWNLKTAGLDGTVTLPDDFAGVATLRILDTQASAVSSLTVGRGATRFSFPSSGRWSVCLASPVTAVYRSGSSCAAVSVAAASPGLGTKPFQGVGLPVPKPFDGGPNMAKRLVVSQHLRIVRRRDQRLSISYDPKDASNTGSKRTFTLVALHGRERREIRGTRRRGRVVFAIRLPRGLWRLHVVVRASAGGVRTSGTVKIRIR
jgi:hypothetical protein